MRATTRLLLVRDPDDALSEARALWSLHRPEHGVVVCHTTPWNGLAALPRDILRALGKRFDAPESVHDPWAQWETAGDWLAGELTMHLIVLRAHLLSAEHAERVWRLAQRMAPETMWLISSGPDEGEGATELRRRQRARRVTVDQLWGELTPRAGHDTQPRAAPVVGFPRVPRADFVLFKRACRHTLEPHELERVGDAIAHGHRAITDNLRQRRRTWPQEIKSLLEDLLMTAACADEALARLRGAQIALFTTKRLLVTFDAERIPALHALHYHSALDRINARRLRIYTSTRLACAGALALTTRDPARVLARVTIGEIGDYARHIGPRERRMRLPGYAGGPVRAHLKRRARQGAGPDDPLFTTHRDPSTPIGLREMHGLLVKVANRSHLTLHTDASPYATSARPLDGQVDLQSLG